MTYAIGDEMRFRRFLTVGPDDEALWVRLYFHRIDEVWAGLRLWVEIPEPPEPEIVSELQHPGDILFVPRWDGLRFVYGLAQMRGPAGPIPCHGSGAWVAT